MLGEKWTRNTASFFCREKLKTKRHEIAENAKVKNDSHEDKPKIGPQISQGWFF